MANNTPAIEQLPQVRDSLEVARAEVDRLAAIRDQLILESLRAGCSTRAVAVAAGVSAGRPNQVLRRHSKPTLHSS